MGPHLGTVPAVASSHHAQPPQSISQRQLTAEDGDIVVTLEVAGIWRSGPGLAAPTVQTQPEYRVSIHGNADGTEHIFDAYATAIADGEALAADRRARLLYMEGHALTLVKDYRSGADF